MAVHNFLLGKSQRTVQRQSGQIAGQDFHGPGPRPHLRQGGLGQSPADSPAVAGRVHIEPGELLLGKGNKAGDLCVLGHENGIVKQPLPLGRDRQGQKCAVQTGLMKLYFSGCVVNGLYARPIGGGIGSNFHIVL